MNYAVLQSCLPALAVAVALACGDCGRGAETAEQTGAIEGTVTYRADAQRPWRYARYYIKRASSGELAEAVVAIRRLPAAATDAPTPKTVTIDQKNFQFTPELVAIRAGDSVTFTNGDDSIHNVRASARIASFNVTIPSGGATHTEQFKKAGGVRDPVQIGCVFHSAMQAWIFVFDHPHFAITDEKGRFRLEGLPPGNYDLEMAHPAGGLHWRRKVDVQAGQTLQVDIAVSPDDKK